VSRVAAEPRARSSTTVSRPDRPPSATDWPATLFLTLGSAALLGFALARPERFAELTRLHPFPAGFVKFFILGAFGELLKRRLTSGRWWLEHVWERAVVWGLFGMWFVMVFPAFSLAVEGLVRQGLWPARVPGVSENLWLAFSKSFWLNGLGMYGWGMMVTHNYFDFVIQRRWRTWGLRAYAAHADRQFLLSFIPKTLLFWIAAQTFNFSRPPEWRVLIAAVLAIVLGFMLGVGTRRK